MRQAQGQKGARGLRPLNIMIKQQNIKVADFVEFLKFSPPPLQENVISPRACYKVYLLA